MTLTIHVTQQDIDDALDLEGGQIAWRGIAEACPVALAVARVIDEPVRVLDSNDGQAGEATDLRVRPIAKGYDNVESGPRLPDDVMARINTYDIERVMFPFDFQMEDPR